MDATITPEATMFDMLTLDEILALQARLSRAHSDALDRLIDRKTIQPLIDPLGDEWAIRSAHMAELGETCSAIHDEIIARLADKAELPSA
jgi:hypothetical protein